jgi:hypothetical protein
MKPSITVILFLLSNTIQAQLLNKDLLKINGLDFLSNKEKIVTELGPPYQIIEPNFECGFLSSDGQGRKFFRLLYPGIQFTGNQNDNYLIEHVDFTNDELLQLTYGELIIDSDSAVLELAELIGADIDTENPNDKIFQAYFEYSDDAILFTFQGARLVKMEYWSPC